MKKRWWKKFAFTYFEIKRNQDIQLACALAKDKNYIAKAKKVTACDKFF